MDVRDRRNAVRGDGADVFKSNDAGEHWHGMGTGPGSSRAVQVPGIRRDDRRGELKGVRRTSDGEDLVPLRGLDSSTVYTFRASRTGRTYMPQGGRRDLAEHDRGLVASSLVRTGDRGDLSLFVYPGDPDHVLAGTSDRGYGIARQGGHVAIRGDERRAGEQIESTHNS